MRANVRHGKISEPKSLQWAIERHKQVLFEIKKVEDQLADPSRAAKLKKVVVTSEASAYDVWRARAEHVVKLFRLEKTQLAAWIETHNGDSATLFRRAYDLLKNLEKDDVEFQGEEIELMKLLDAHFEPKMEKAG